jgi:sec-independent protein translocase protein TatC
MALVPFSSRSRSASTSPASSSRSAETPSGIADLLGGMSILERLDELRRRLVRSALVVAVAVLVGFAFINQIVDYLLAPTRRALPAGTKLIYTQPGEAFGLYVQIALIVGVVLAMPFLMYQVWQLVTPLIPKSARRFAIPFVLFTTIGFIAGAAFNHYVAFPYMMTFFATFNTPDLLFRPRVEDVFDLYTKMLLGMGAVFQMPAAVFFLAKAGIVSAGLLWRSFKYAFLLIFIVAAVITPTGDMVTQTIFAAPMVALYLLSILVAWIFGPSRAAREDEGEQE